MTPYNYPVNMIAWKVGPALAAGCTVVLLPSPRGALCSVAVVRLAEEAGVPPGVLNLVPGGPDVGQRLSAHPDVDMVSFTGSNAIGAAVAEAAAPLHTKVVLELGGKSPTVVLPGADLARAVGPSMLRFCRNAGQGCGATTRILVHRSQYDEFVDAAVAFLRERVPVGDPRDEETEVGPLISAEHRQRVEGYLQRAVDGGATLLTGGGRPDLPGFYLEPALVADVDAADEICQDELFAPVATVMAYDTVDEAVALANDSRYGLNALVWGDPERGPRRGAPPGDRHGRHQRRRWRPAGRARGPASSGPVSGARWGWTATPSSSRSGTCSGRRNDTEAPRPEPRPRRRLAGRAVGRGRREPAVPHLGSGRRPGADVDPGRVRR